jgi:hypothetical protein
MRGAPVSTVLSPPVSDFETAEQESDYTAWLQAKITASLAGERLPISHNEIERRMAIWFENMRVVVV